MQREQIAEMYALETSHWWFWGKRLVMRRLLGRHLTRGGGQEESGSALRILPNGSALRILPNGSALRILDIGCGAGATALELAGYGEVTASDRSLDALAFVRSRGVAAVVAAEAPWLPFRDGAFDIVTAYDVIEHVEDDQTFVRELARVLAPGGALAVHVPAWPFLWSNHDEVLEHKRRYTRRGLRNLLTESGLEIETLGWTNFTVFAPTVVLRWAKKLVGSDHGKADLGVVPAPFNALLRGICRLEAAVAATTGLPIGVSLAAIAIRREKPASSPASPGGQTKDLPTPSPKETR